MLVGILQNVTVCAYFTFSFPRHHCLYEAVEQIGKNFFRLGHEVDFRGNKSLFVFCSLFHLIWFDLPLRRAWTHWGCSSTFIQNIKSSYASVDAIEGYSDLKDDEKEKVKRAYDEGDIPEDDRGIGEAVEGLEKKKVVRKKKKEESEEEGNDDGEEDRPKKRVRKAKVCITFSQIAQWIDSSAHRRTTMKTNQRREQLL